MSMGNKNLIVGKRLFFLPVYHFLHYSLFLNTDVNSEQLYSALYIHVGYLSACFTALWKLNRNNYCIDIHACTSRLDTFLMDFTMHTSTKSYLLCNMSFIVYYVFVSVFLIH